MARTKSVIMSKEETKAALAAANLDLKELKVTQKTIAAERKTLDKDHAVAVKASDKAIAAGEKAIAAKIAEIEALSVK